MCISCTHNQWAEPNRKSNIENNANSNVHQALLSCKLTTSAVSLYFFFYLFMQEAIIMSVVGFQCGSHIDHEPGNGCCMLRQNSMHVLVFSCITSSSMLKSCANTCMEPKSQNKTLSLCMSMLLDAVHCESLEAISVLRTCPERSEI